MTEAGQGRDGAMLAIAVGAADVRELLGREPELAESLVIANDNAPHQVVLAGPGPDIARAAIATKAAGWTSLRLPVATAFHSRLVADSRDPFAAHLQTLSLQQPNFPVYANATAQPYGAHAADQLADQLGQPVRFREMIETMARDGVTRFIEVGPGRVLTKLVEQILSETPHLAVALDDPKADGLRGWHRGLATLAADAVALDLVALFGSYLAPDQPEPVPAHAVMVGGAPLGKPDRVASGTTSHIPKRGRTVVPGVSPPVTDAYSPAPIAEGLSADAWSLVDRIRQETAEQHQNYLDVMAQSHQAFLDMSVRMLADISGEHAAAESVPAPTARGQHAATTGPDISMPAPPAEAPRAEAASARHLQPEPAAAAEPAPPQSVAEAVVAIVSEKTGYPADMLGLDMEMEAELGIDSIKQVEILSALQAQTPGAPDIPASKLATLRTLQDVVDSVADLTTVAPVQTPAPTRIPATQLHQTETVLRPRSASGFAMAGLRDGEVFITREDPAFAAALERALTSRGIKARAVDEVPEQAGAVICLAALAAVDAPEDCVEMHLRAFRAARSVARSSAASRLFVTVQSTGGAFLGNGAPIGVASIVKSAAWEWANASVRAIDIESLDPERLTRELIAGGGGIEVALR
ncbi:MAG TPA: phosphopantetheine-binding protein, partial [Mycobacterium sp.]|nr:phosphopantetheine-binding protein [Mycobacterium sp.]